ncbi:MAG TPA: type VI secretion system tube protein Hcp [Bryobacteraceae bacterium]|nr:type VI secretion system tube protein Hcp [Bryobacteraceae bacterium]
MAVDYFLNLNGIKGEAQDKVYPGWIDIYSWSFGATQSGGGGHVGGGSGAGKVNMHDITVSKRTDTSSSDLFLKTCNGKHYDTGTIVARKAGENPLEFLKIKLTQILVTSYQLGGSHGDDTPTESITLNFRTINMTYQVQKPDGTGQTAGDAGWDVAQNVKL